LAHPVEAIHRLPLHLRHHPEPAADADQREPEERPAQPQQVGDHGRGGGARCSHRLAGTAKATTRAVLTCSTPTRTNTATAITAARRPRSETPTTRAVVTSTMPTTAATMPCMARTAVGLKAPRE